MMLPRSVFDGGDGDKPDSPGQAEDAQPHMAVTALDGSFFLPHIAPGEYMVMAFASGYLSPLDGIEVNRKSGKPDRREETLLRATAPIVRVIGPEAARIDIELQRGAVLSGKVVYSDGAPASQLPVLLQKSSEFKVNPEDPVDMGAMIRSMFLQQRITTDDQGQFRLSSIAPGSYRLAVVQSFESGADPGEEMLAAFNPMTKQTGMLTVYSGNTLHRKDAKVYDLKAGDTASDIEIVLPLNGLHSIHGTATGKDGTPLNSGSLDLGDTTDSAITFHAAIGVDGEFRFGGIPEGTYELKASNGRLFENPVQQQFKPIRAFADTSVPVAVQTTDIDDLTVTLPDIKLPDIPKQPQFQGNGQAVGEGPE